MKQYRIGDFARCLGVTADFLKHYENAGLIDVRQHENGYRYYPFDQSARIIEYLRLRNYGVTVKEMGDFLTGNAEEAVALLDDKTAALEAEVCRMNAVIEAHRRLKRWYGKRQQRPIDWEIRETEPFEDMGNVAARHQVRACGGRRFTGRRRSCALGICGAGRSRGKVRTAG